MELTLTIILGVIIGAIICELIDSALGMMYGTILSPVLILAGFPPLLVVPSILISQAMGGLTAAVLHQRLGNANFVLKGTNPEPFTARLVNSGYEEPPKRGMTEDLKVSLCVTCFGVIATIFSVMVAISIPKVALTSYIGILVLVMGVLLLLKPNFKFSWKRIIGVGILSAFNKGLSGGGYGPIVTSGQMLSGRKGKNSIGATTLAEAPICITGFLTYLFTKGISSWNFASLLIVGAIIGGIIGPFLTTKFKSEKKLKLILGILVLFLGVFVLLNTWILKIKGAGA